MLTVTVTRRELTLSICFQYLNRGLGIDLEAWSFKMEASCRLILIMSVSLTQETARSLRSAAADTWPSLTTTFTSRRDARSTIPAGVILSWVFIFFRPVTVRCMRWRARTSIHEDFHPSILILRLVASLHFLLLGQASIANSHSD